MESSPFHLGADMRRSHFPSKFCSFGSCGSYSFLISSSFIEGRSTEGAPSRYALPVQHSSKVLGTEVVTPTNMQLHENLCGQNGIAQPQALLYCIRNSSTLEENEKTSTPDLTCSLTKKSFVLLITKVTCQTSSG